MDGWMDESIHQLWKFASNFLITFPPLPYPLLQLPCPLFPFPAWRLEGQTFRAQGRRVLCLAVVAVVHISCRRPTNYGVSNSYLAYRGGGWGRGGKEGRRERSRAKYSLGESAHVLLLHPVAA